MIWKLLLKNGLFVGIQILFYILFHLTNQS